MLSGTGMKRWIDLTRKLESGMPVYPGDPMFQTVPFADHETDGFRGVRLAMGSHLGTHMDAPYHYFVDGETLDYIPLDFFFGDAAVLDLTTFLKSEKTGQPPEIRLEYLTPFEPVFENVPRIILRTGWDKHWRKSDYYSLFPSFYPETVEWLADFPLKVLGLETPSLSAFDWNVTDPEAEQPVDEVTLHADAECHRILLGRQPPILILEGLTRLETLPAFRVTDLEKLRRLSPKTIRQLFASCFELNGNDSTKRTTDFDLSGKVNFSDDSGLPDGCTSDVLPGERPSDSELNFIRQELAVRLFSLSCFPLLFDRSDGSPVRAVACLQEIDL